ncbi:MAG TPA: TrkA family potassium uptake protein [Candidatus Methylomirabilis sp.]|jgi:trk system potassium uptake protein TrkA|nr:TrkA family potassium uptake protein [Candidatus Methylomirabilis sp.]
MKQILVAGLGRFGEALALTLEEAGVEVIAVDTDPNHVEAVKDRVTHVAQLDSTDLNALKAIGAEEVDAAVVAMGKDFEASVLTTAALKELGIKRIVVRANTAREARILRLAGADRVVFVEQEMGQRLGKALVGESVLDHIALAEGYAMIQWAIDERLTGKTLGESQLRTRHRVNVVAIKKREVTKGEDGSEQVRERLDPVPHPEYRFAPGDILVLVGKESDLEALTEA